MELLVLLYLWGAITFGAVLLAEHGNEYMYTTYVIVGLLWPALIPLFVVLLAWEWLKLRF